MCTLQRDVQDDSNQSVVLHGAKRNTDEDTWMRDFSSGIRRSNYSHCAMWTLSKRGRPHIPCTQFRVISYLAEDFHGHAQLRFVDMHGVEAQPSLLMTPQDTSVTLYN